MLQDILAGEPIIEEGIYYDNEVLEAYLTNLEYRAEVLKKTAAQRSILQQGMARVELERIRDDYKDLPEVLAELDKILFGFVQRINGISSQFFASVPELSTEISQKDAIASQRINEPEYTVQETLSMELDLLSSEQLDTAKTVKYDTNNIHIISEEELSSFQNLYEELCRITHCWRELKAEGLNRSNGRSLVIKRLDARILICTLGKLMAKAHERDLAVRIQNACEDLVAEMQYGCSINGDTMDAPPFTALKRDQDLALTVHDWEKIIDVYSDLKDARKAMDWCLNNRENLSDIYMLSLLIAICAKEELCRLAFEYFNLEEGLQKNLDDQIIDQKLGKKARKQVNTSTEDKLLQLSSNLADMLRKGEIDREQTAERKLKTQQIEDAFSAVKNTFEQYPALGSDPDHLEEDKQKVIPLLEDLTSRGVRNSSKRLMKLLLPQKELANVVEGDPRYDALKFIWDEQNITKCAPASKINRPEPVDEADPTDTEIQEYLKVVQPFVEGKRILILGGNRRIETVRCLKDKLNCDDINWPSANKNDRATKFEKAIRNSFVVLLLKNYAGHELIEKGREWAKEEKNHSIFMPGGYGCNQVVFRIYEYIKMHKSEMV